MGFFTLVLAGVGFILIGMWESLLSSSQTPKLDQSSITPGTRPGRKYPYSSPLTFFSIALLSFFFICNSLYSLIDAVNSKDRVGSPLQLQVLATAFLFLLYAVLGLLMKFTDSIPLPSSFLSLICLFAFAEEFLLFYLQRKDTVGIENRYFDMMLVPITICLFSTVLELKSPKSNLPRLARGIGLYEKSRGNYTVRCKGHPEYHRGRAIATLQFNFHLAFLVVLVVAAFSIISRRNGGQGGSEQYRPIGAETHSLDLTGQFSLASDDDEIKGEESMEKQKPAAIEMGANGHGSH
ncbi:hypothetical protein CK203_067204 [Vitis vinifera]|uniref:Uncharacterized protein n=1 Tax=Vitis vinifera TaxID=29760 RepID=A0A438EFG8_VITVI|nr:hypothetical protein CK203_067204 [Vitis vinifera]